MPETRIQALQRMPIFGGMRAEVLEFLLDAAEFVQVAQRKFFFHEHDKAQSMFVLETGEVAVLKLWQGQYCLLGHLRQGDCFGEMALMDLKARSASIMAIKDCKAIELSTASIYKLYEKDLEQFALLQMNIGREVSRRLRASDERLFRTHMGALDLDSERPIPYA